MYHCIRRFVYSNEQLHYIQEWSKLSSRPHTNKQTPSRLLTAQHKRTDAHTHTHTVYIHTDTHAHMYVHINTHAHTEMHTCTHTRAHTLCEDTSQNLDGVEEESDPFSRSLELLIVEL